MSWGGRYSKHGARPDQRIDTYDELASRSRQRNSTNMPQSASVSRACAQSLSVALTTGASSRFASAANFRSLGSNPASISAWGRSAYSPSGRLRSSMRSICETVADAGLSGRVQMSTLLYVLCVMQHARQKPDCCCSTACRLVVSATVGDYGPGTHIPCSHRRGAVGARRGAARPAVRAKAREHIVGHANTQGAPDLVDEIVLPSSAMRDWRDKLDLYARHRVREYWLLSPEAAPLGYSFSTMATSARLEPIAGARL